jgi:heme A synthase
MRTTRTLAAIWILALTAIAIVGVLTANWLFSLGWGRAHDNPLPFVAVACVVACLCLLARRKRA